jgi:hypothetical protein
LYRSIGGRLVFGFPGINDHGMMVTALWPFPAAATNDFRLP